MIIKEWRCAEHGTFEATHAICPHLGCESEHVERVFLTAPGFKSDKTKGNDAFMNNLAERYGMTDMSNKDGKAIKATNPGAAIWGKENVKDFNTMLAGAATPTHYTAPDGRKLYADNMGMRAACQQSGLDQRRLPPAQVIRARNDTADRSLVEAQAK